MKTRPSLIVLIFVGALEPAYAQRCADPPSLTSFLRCEILARESGSEKDLAKQVEAPAASANSTALADSAASPDLIGLSVTPAFASTRSFSPNANDFSGVLNLYGLYTAVTRKNPFGLETYQDTSAWRRFSLSFDHSTSVDNLKTDLVGNTNTYVAKAVLLGFRDIAARSNFASAQDALDSMANADAAFAKLERDIAEYLFPHHASGGDVADFFNTLQTDPSGFRRIWATLAVEEKRAIGAMIARQMDAQQAVEAKLTSTIKSIQNQRQLSADFTSRLSYSGGANLYRSEAILDWGFRQGWIASTTNVSYDFQNSRTVIVKNRQIVRLVEQITKPILSVIPWTSDPLLAVVSAEGDFGTNGTPIYKTQFKAVIPLRLGLAMPLTFQYVNRTAAGTRGDIKVQLGLTFDLDKAIVDSYAIR
jgi:hypothetical protein